MKILGFGHRKRVGKDTAAKFALSYLKQHYPKLSCCRISFGDQLKDISERMFSWGGLECGVYYSNHPELIEQTIPAIGKSPRQIWDEMGLTGRNIHPNVWVNMAAHNADGDILISPDVRFPTEIDLIRKFGGWAVKVSRPQVPKVNTAVDEALTNFDGWDAILLNDKTFKDLNTQVRDLVDSFVKEWFPDA
jgi:hypothetical protein